MPADLTISIINHSNPEMLRDCLRSIYASVRVISIEVWVVDNATDRRLVAEMQAEFPQARWLFNKERLGFSANHNRVLCENTSRYICILNDDTVIHEAAFDRLVQYMDENPKMGMAGPRLLNGDGSHQNCVFRDMTLWTEMVSICILPGKFDGLKSKACIHPALNGESPAVVDWILGAVMVVRAQTLREVGLLDAKLSPIGNTEDVDWCWRARAAGWPVAFQPLARVTHFGNQSFKGEPVGPDRRYVDMMRTRLAFFRKHYGWLQAALLRLIYAFSLPWNMIMLVQGRMRGRLATPKYHQLVATYRLVAWRSLFHGSAYSWC